MRRPIVLSDAGNAPKHAKRPDRPRRLDRAHILRVPAKLVQNLRDGCLAVVVIAADEHGRPSAGEHGIDHLPAAYRIERLDEMSGRVSLLQLLHQRLVLGREEWQDSIDWRAAPARVAGGGPPLSPQPVSGA